MKLFIVALCVACAAANSADENAEVLRSSYVQTPDGAYQYNYETANGISGQASASLKALGKDEVAIVVQGGNKYVSPEGDIIETSYIADENGYQPQGAHLPTPPPTQAIPEYIQRSLAYIKEHPYVEEKPYVEKKN